MTMKRMLDVFKEIEKKWKIPARTSRLYVQEGLYPRPELRGRKGYYDLVASQIIERAGIIKLLQEYFSYTLNGILRVLRKYESGDLGLLLSQIEYIAKRYPKYRTANLNYEHGPKKVRFFSARNAVTRRKFMEAVNSQKTGDAVLRKIENEMNNLEPWDFEELCYEYGISVYDKGIKG